jgi:hypothetical protein
MILRLLVAASVACGIACGGEPTRPSPISQPAPAPQAPPSQPMATISGTVWLHSAAAVVPFASARLFGWLDLGTSGRTTGHISIDASGRYVYMAPIGSRVRLYAGGAYQPCEVTVAVTGDVTRDLRAVDDPRQLGARLPSELLADTPLLSGQVFEIDNERRQPLADVRVELDGLFGLGVVTATTLTDAEGRYVLCGLNGETSTTIFASKSGFRLFEGTTPITGNTTLDIELRR